MDLRRSERLANLHIHPYVLCIIDMQPVGFENSLFILKEVLDLVKEAILEKAFIVVSQFTRCGDTHEEIRQELENYPYKEYLCHKKNNKSNKIREILISRNLFVRKIKVCGVNTEYCVKDTVHGLSKKYRIPIQVIERACNGNEKYAREALDIMKSYKNVEVISDLICPQFIYQTIFKGLF